MITRNAIRCNKCGDEIESHSVHDFVTCKCGAVSVDGGHEYLRRLGEAGDWEELSEPKLEVALSKLGHPCPVCGNNTHDESWVVAEGWAMPEKAYYKGVRHTPCPSVPCPDHGKRLWGEGQQMGMHSTYERQVHVYLDRAPKGSHRVLIVEAGE